MREMSGNSNRALRCHALTPVTDTCVFDPQLDSHGNYVDYWNRFRRGGITHTREGTMEKVPLWMATWLRMFDMVKLPLSGDVSQIISPSTSWFPINIDIDYQGDPEIEREIELKEVSTGKQLGKITDALIALADELAKTDKPYEEPKAIDDLRKIALSIDDIKANYYRDKAAEYKEHAEHALEKANGKTATSQQSR